MSEPSLLDAIFQSWPGSVMAIVLAPVVAILMLRQRRERTPGRARALEWIAVALLAGAAVSALHGRVEIAPWIGVGAALLVAGLAAAGSGSRGVLATSTVFCAAGLYLGIARLQRLIVWWTLLDSGELGETDPAPLAVTLALGLGLSLVALVFQLAVLRPRVSAARALVLLLVLAAGIAWLVPAVRARTCMVLGAHAGARDVLLAMSYAAERSGDVDRVDELEDALSEILVDLLERDDPGLRRLTEYLDLTYVSWDAPMLRLRGDAGPAVQAKLERAFRDGPDPVLRRWAAWNLESFEDVSAATDEALLEALESPDEVLSRLALELLERTWPPSGSVSASAALAGMAELARVGPGGRQLAAIEALGAIGSESSEARAVLTELASTSEDPVASTAALLALARWQGEPALLALCSQLLGADAGAGEEPSESVTVGQVLALGEICRLGTRAAALMPEVAAAERSRSLCRSLGRVVSWEAWNAWLALAPAAPEIALPRLRRMIADWEASKEEGGPPVDSSMEWRIQDVRRVLREIERQ